MKKKECEGKVHRNTLLLKQMHENLTKKSNQLDFKPPDLGIMEFLKDFQDSIVTKVILFNIYSIYYKSSIKFI